MQIKNIFTTGLAIATAISFTTACDKGAADAEAPDAKAPAMEKGTEDGKDHAAMDHGAADKKEAAAFALPTAGGKVVFTDVKDGATLTGPLKDGKVEVSLKFGAEGIKIAPAGKLDTAEGHHHVLIDTADVKAGEIIAADDSHIHYGKGQTEAKVALAPGEHTLTMQLADGIHRSYGEAWRSKVKITVAAAK